MSEAARLAYVQEKIKIVQHSSLFSHSDLIKLASLGYGKWTRKARVS
jgi:hypothetical protein